MLVDRITEDMLIREVLTAHPEAAAVFERHGLACASCLAADMETVSSVAGMHEVNSSVLLEELNALFDERGARSR